MNRDEIRGKADVVRGKFKQAAADLTDNPTLHDRGAAQEAAGKTRQAVGHAKRTVGEAIEAVGKAVKK